MNPLITPNGNAARLAPTLEPPSVAGMAKFFGFMVDVDGIPYPNTVRVDDIVALWPVKQGGYQALLRVGNGVPIGMPDTDALRLMKILGWRETSAIERVS